MLTIKSFDSCLVKNFWLKNNKSLFINIFIFLLIRVHEFLYVTFEIIRENFIYVRSIKRFVHFEVLKRTERLRS